MLDVQKFIGTPKIVVDQINDDTWSFELQYLPSSLGHSLGNAIRRIALAYSAGGAVTALKIKGINHEYSAISGITETVIIVMLHFKKIRFRLAETVDKITWLSQKFSGVGIVTAADLKLSSGIEILNPEVVLFEITDPNTEILFDMRVEKGYGYYSLDYLRVRESKSEFTDINLLLIDNDFDAIKSITYEVKEIIDDFTGGSKDLLKIVIQTVSSHITAQEILSFAGEVLSSYAKIFVFDASYIDSSLLVDHYDVLDKKPQERGSFDFPVKTIPIDALPLSERTRNALIKNNILYVEDLEKKRKSELLTMKGIGRKAVDEIVESLEQLGRSLDG